MNFNARPCRTREILCIAVVEEMISLMLHCFYTHSWFQQIFERLAPIEKNNYLFFELCSKWKQDFKYKL